MHTLLWKLSATLMIVACTDQQAAPSGDGMAPIASGEELSFPALERISVSIPDEDLPVRPIGTLALTAHGSIAYRPDNRHEPLITVIDSTGHVLSRWGTRGEGPGELLGDEFLLSSDSHVVAAGTGGQSVRVYDVTGRLVEHRAGPPAGIPTAMAGGAIAWWTAFSRGAGPRSAFRQGRRGPVTHWCVLSECSTAILEASDPVVLAIDSAAPPPGSGGWPPATLTRDELIVADGYSYTIWRISLRDPTQRRQFTRILPPRRVTEREFASADSGWVELERNGIPGPGGQRIRENFDREREFLRSTPRPHFQMFGLSVDGRGRLWVIGKANDSTFVDVFSDTTFLGRHMIDCDRTGYAGAVRGKWLALGCEDQSKDFPYELRLYRIVEPDTTS